MCGKAEGEAAKLAEDVYDVVSSWLSCKKPTPECWNEKKSPMYASPSVLCTSTRLEYSNTRRTAMAYAEVQKLGKNGRSNLLSRARKTVSRMKSLAHTFNELAAAIQARFETAKENMEVVKNMCGLASLPNELLGRIFECVVNGDASLLNAARWKAAVILSHVCPHFRDTALSCPQLWVNISRSDEMAALCLSRSGDLHLDVELIVEFIPGAEPHELLFDQLLLEALPHSQRWSRLSVQFVSNSWDDVPVNSTPTSGSDIRQAFRGVDAPLLNSLCIWNDNSLDLDSLQIWNDDSLDSIYRRYDEFAQWNTPNLRHLTTMHYFPLSLPSLANVTTLDITLILNQINFAHLLKDLSKMCSLDDFSLTLDCCMQPFMEPGEVRSYERTELPSVRRLKIETEFEYLLHSHSRPIKRSIFSSLFFPGAIDLHVRLSGVLFQSDPSPDNLPEFLNLNKREVMCIFRHVEQFPRVERFCLEISARYSDDDFRGGEWITLKVVPPLHMLPSVKHFILQSNVGLYMDKYFGGEGDDDDDEGVVPPRILGNFEPALQTITVDMFKTDYAIEEWVGTTLRKQKERGEWEAFRELIITVVDEGSGEKVTETYFGDDALAGCKARL